MISRVASSMPTSRPQEIRSRGRLGREEQRHEQYEYDGQDIHPQDLTRSEPDAPAKTSTAKRRALPTAVGRCLISGLVRSPDRNYYGWVTRLLYFAPVGMRGPPADAKQPALEAWP